MASNPFINTASLKFGGVNWIPGTETQGEIAFMVIRVHALVNPFKSGMDTTVEQWEQQFMIGWIGETT
jgi:hypothetical protein